MFIKSKCEKSLFKDFYSFRRDNKIIYHSLETLVQRQSLHYDNFDLPT